MSETDERREMDLGRALYALEALLHATKDRAWPHVERAALDAVTAAVAERDALLVEVEELRLELHRHRMALLRSARRTVDVPEGSYVLHVDGDPTNNDPENLVIVRPDEHT